MLKTRLFFFLAFALLFLPACQEDRTVRWQGYAEGEYLYMAASRGGRLQSLTAEKGKTVSSGASLFRLDPEPEATVVTEMRRRLEQAGFRRDDLESGERPSEIAALIARREQARAARDLAEAEYGRQERLLSAQVIPREQFERGLAEMAQKRAAVAELDARLTTARLGGRSRQRQALSAEALAAAEYLRQAEWTLAEKSLSAPEEALVFDTLFTPGEFVPAGTPVVVLLPAKGRKVRFFVPEEELSTLHPGTRVRLHFDGGNLPATVSYISPQAEFTPPVIYSRDSRSKLVYLVEARPLAIDALRLNPGQPLEVVTE